MPSPMSNQEPHAIDHTNQQTLWHPTCLILLGSLLSPPLLADDFVPCRYYNAKAQEMVKHPHCMVYAPRRGARGKDSDGRIASDVLRQTGYGQHGLAYLHTALGPFYYNQAGRLRRTFFFDNGPDYFEEGLARTVRGDKIGFIDTRLNLVIPPEYNFAAPFNKGLAEVGMECTSQKFDMEHSVTLCAAWGAIDKKGRLRRPLVRLGDRDDAKLLPRPALSPDSNIPTTPQP